MFEHNSVYSDVRKRCSHPIYYQDISRKQPKSDLEKLTVARLRTRLRPSIPLSESASWGFRKWSHRCNNSNDELHSQHQIMEEPEDVGNLVADSSPLCAIP